MRRRVDHQQAEPRDERSARGRAAKSRWRSGDACSRARRSETMIEPRRHRRSVPVRPAGASTTSVERQVVEALHDPRGRSAPRSRSRSHPPRPPRARRTSASAAGVMPDEPRRVLLALRPARYRSCPPTSPFGKPANAAAAVPFSSSTTPVKPGEDRRRGSGTSTWPTVDRRQVADLLAARRRSTATRGAARSSVPPFANVAYALASWSGVDEHVALADRRVDVVAGEPVGVRERRRVRARGSAAFHAASGTRPVASFGSAMPVGSAEARTRARSSCSASPPGCCVLLAVVEVATDRVEVHVARDRERAGRSTRP